jgi:hypothetical protein
MTRFGFFFRIENIAIPAPMKRQLYIRMPTTRVEDMERVAREVWGFPEWAEIQVWRGGPGSVGRRRMGTDEEMEAGEDVWIRGVPVSNEEIEPSSKE